MQEGKLDRNLPALTGSSGAAVTRGGGEPSDAAAILAAFDRFFATPPGSALTRHRTRAQYSRLLAYRCQFMKALYRWVGVLHPRRCIVKPTYRPTIPLSALGSHITVVQDVVDTPLAKHHHRLQGTYFSAVFSFLANEAAALASGEVRLPPPP